MKIAVIAHRGKKESLATFLREYRAFLRHAELVATATTGAHVIQLNLGFRVTSVLSGPMGGDAQIAAMVVTGELDMVLFFRDPLDAHPHEADVQMLMRLCDVHEVPLATNPATATLLLESSIGRLIAPQEDDRPPVAARHRSEAAGRERSTVAAPS